MAYATVVQLKEYLDISTNTDDNLLQSILVRAQAWIDQYTHRTFEASANTSRTFDTERDVDGQVLYLDEDLASINSITNGDGDVLTTSEYTTEPRNRTPYYAIRLLASSNLAWEYSSSTDDPENAITISGKWAWSTSAPADIVAATLRLAAYLYRQRDNAADLDRTIIAGSATVLPPQMPRDVELALLPYRKMQV